jgi:tryptophan synthase alpha chain
MGYANPVERMGRTQFARAAQAAGVDGVILVDYPPEEAVESSGQLRAVGIDPIFLVTPTTTDARIAAIAAQAAGFLYYVSLKGITGAAHLDVAAVASRLPMIRRFTGLPVAVGFGIREAATAKAMAQVADAIVIGSRIIEEMEAVSAEQAVQAAEKFVAEIRIAIDNAPVVRAA